MISEGIKTRESDRMVTQKFTRMHLEIGIESLNEIINHGESVKHLKFE